VDRLAAVEARRAGILALLPSDYRVEREGAALLLLRGDGSAVAAFRVEDVRKREAKIAEEERGRSRRGGSTA
jgi:hypothetical protein